MNRMLDRYIGSFVTFLAIVSYFELFSLTAIPYSYRILSKVAVGGLMLALIIVRIIYLPGTRIKMNFAFPVLIMIVSSIPSYFIARAYHNQSFLVSVYANKVIWFYLLYFFVHFYNVRVRFILRLIILVGLFAVVLYYVQLYFYPVKILDSGVLKGRGTIRLFVAGMICTQAAYFYFLNQFFAKNKTIYLIFSMLALSIFILQGTRQLIFGLTFLTLVNLLFSRRIHSRFMITLVLSLALFAIFLVFRDIFIELNKISSSQSQDLGGGIRLKAARFYLTSFMPSAWAYIFGNSNAALGSSYDQKMIMYAVKNGFYISDIGILGDYIKYGIIFTVVGLVMLIRAIRFNISKELQYLKFYIFSQCFTLITGYGILGGVDVVILLILYVFDVDRAEKLKEKVSRETAEENPETATKFITP